MFADDCLLYREICSMNETKMLLGNLDSLQAWEQDCLMEFKPAKCEAITFTKKTKSMKAEYRLYDVILTAVTSAKYLGVHISRKLFWSTRQYDCQEGYSVTQLYLEKLQLLTSTHP